MVYTSIIFTYVFWQHLLCCKVNIFYWFYQNKTMKNTTVVCLTAGGVKPPKSVFPSWLSVWATHCYSEVALRYRIEQSLPWCFLGQPSSWDVSSYKATLAWWYRSLVLQRHYLLACNPLSYLCLHRFPLGDLHMRCSSIGIPCQNGVSDTVGSLRLLVVWPALKLLACWWQVRCRKQPSLWSHVWKNLLSDEGSKHPHLCPPR